MRYKNVSNRNTFSDSYKNVLLKKTKHFYLARRYSGKLAINYIAKTFKFYLVILAMDSDVWY